MTAIRHMTEIRLGELRATVTAPSPEHALAREAYRIAVALPDVSLARTGT